MTPERWSQIQEKLEIAVALEPGKRAVFLAEVAAGDPEMRDELESLLAQESGGPTFLKTAALSSLRELDGAGVPQHDTAIGRMLGPYQVTELLAEGGMGEVYRAFRADDQYKKQVAIKLVRVGHDSALVLNRFRNERQILASLDHPNIARLLDGGTTREGIPYLVMELIEGRPIDEYCDTHKLNVTARLELFLQVCAAVQYAHSRLIVHRDLKPGNILVTAEGQPKLLDFGIAKILDPVAFVGAQDATMTMLRVLTPAYASPEQVRGETITTASDVYSLGVVLYELLTGHHPYRASGPTADAMARAVLEGQPEKPSSVIRRVEADNPGQAEITPATVSAVRQSTPDKLRKRLSGDLDNIVLMALRKEPERRYRSVDQFAEDLSRHLRDLPVAARGDLWAYRTKKFVARHRAAVMAAALVTLTLIVGLVVTLREVRIARAERARAERRFNDVRTLANSLMFDIHDAIRDLPGSTPARKILLDKALQYLDSLAKEAGNDPALLRELATAYERVAEVQGHYLNDNLGDTGASLRSYQKALTLRERLVSTPGSNWQDRLALANSCRNVASQLLATGDAGNALVAVRKAIAASESTRIERPSEVKVLDELAYDYEIEGHVEGGQGFTGVGLDDPAQVLRSYRKAVETDEAWLRLAPDNTQALHSYGADLLFLADVTGRSDPEAAIKEYNQALEIAKTVSERTGSSRRLRDVAVAYNRVAGTYEGAGNWRKALEEYQAALEIYRQLVKREPSDVMMKEGFAIALANVGVQRQRLTPNRGLPFIRQAVDVMEGVVAADKENAQGRGTLATIYIALGDALKGRHKLPDALSEYQKALALYERLSARDAHNADAVGGVGECKLDIAGVFAAMGDYRSASKSYSESLAAIEPVVADPKSDESLLRTAADSYAGLGDVEMRLSRRSARGSAAEKSHRQRAQDWYLKSQDAWERIPQSLRNAQDTAEYKRVQAIASRRPGNDLKSQVSP